MLVLGSSTTYLEPDKKGILKGGILERMVFGFSKKSLKLCDGASAGPGTVAQCCIEKIAIIFRKPEHPFFENTPFKNTPFIWFQQLGKEWFIRNL